MSDEQSVDEKLEKSVKGVLPTLQGVDNVIDAAKFVPVQYFSERDKEGGDDTFIVKRSHVEDIKRYVRAGLALPVDISKVEAFLGYTELDVIELSPREIQGFHQRIHQHALSWSTLERQTKVIGNQLDLFARNFYKTGETVLGVLRATEAYQNFKGNLDALSEEEREQLRGALLSETDRGRVETFVKGLTRARFSIATFYLDVTAVNALANEFSRKLTDELLIEVDLKINAVNAAQLEGHEHIDQLRERLTQLDVEISEKQSEYDAYVGYAFTGMVFGPIGLVITGGIFGDKAETIRKQKNQLLQEKSELIGTLSKARLSQSMLTLATAFTEMHTLMDDAKQGIKCLEDVLSIVWSSLGVSLDAFPEEPTELELLLLVLDLQAVFDPWKTIEGHARALSKAFNQVAEAE